MTQWVEITDRLPRPYVMILAVAIDPREVIQGHPNKNGDFCWRRDSYGDEEICTITHWMPLPEPPTD